MVLVLRGSSFSRALECLTELFEPAAQATVEGATADARDDAGDERLVLAALERDRLTGERLELLPQALVERLGQGRSGGDGGLLWCPLCGGSRSG